jgi:superfamily II DNA or RNA helicase
MALELRDYQIAMTREARAHVRAGRKRVMLVAPTGSGKRILAGAWIVKATSLGKSTWFLVHRRELIDQSSEMLNSIGIPHGIIAPGNASSRQPVQIASIQTLARRRQIQPPDIIILDEAHHCCSKTWDSVLKRSNGAIVLMLTATPQRLDGKGLAKYADALVVGPSVRDLIEAGYLARYRMFAPTSPNTKGVSTVGGDYARDELAALVDRPQIVGDVVAHYQRLAPDKRAVVFACTRLHARHIAEAMQAAGIAAMYVGGDTPRQDRRDLLSAFAVDSRTRRVQALCSVDILGEGLDVPGIECVVCARPTRSLTLCLQQWGRGLRPKPEPCIILDHAGNSMRHGLPDDDREWTLTEDRPKRPATAEHVRTCTRCFAVYRSLEPACPQCGYQAAPKPRRLREVDGELHEVERQASIRTQRRLQGRAATLDELVALGRQRGYRWPEAWAKHVMRARNG